MIGSIARVRVPASSANLGPGYDCAGLALALYDELTAKVVADEELTIKVSGEGAESVPRDDTHLVIQAIARGFAEAGALVPGLRLTCLNQIPHGRGLGSSSAAIVAGLGLARELLDNGAELLPDDRLIALAADMEGHPDNVAPAVLGRFTLAWTDEYGVGRGLRLAPEARLQPVVAIPRAALSTERARELLPAQISHADAAANSGRAALLVEAMTAHPELLLVGTEDRLHQQYRRFAYPESYALLTTLRNQGIPAVISGAGPTVLAVGLAGSEYDSTAVSAAMAAALVTQGSAVRQGFEVIRVAVANHGLRVLAS